MKVSKKKLANMDKKDLLNLALELLWKNNRKMSLKKLKDEYYDYFDSSYFDEKITKSQFLNDIMQEEENYKIEYSEDELRDFILAIQ